MWGRPRTSGRSTHSGRKPERCRRCSCSGTTGRAVKAGFTAAGDVDLAAGASVVTVDDLCCACPVRGAADDVAAHCNTANRVTRATALIRERSRTRHHLLPGSVVRRGISSCGAGSAPRSAGGRSGPETRGPPGVPSRRSLGDFNRLVVAWSRPTPVSCPGGAATALAAAFAAAAFCFCATAAAAAAAAAAAWLEGPPTAPPRLTSRRPAGARHLAAPAFPATTVFTVGLATAAPPVPAAAGALPMTGSPTRGSCPSTYGFGQFAAVGAGICVPVMRPTASKSAWTRFGGSGE